MNEIKQTIKSFTDLRAWQEGHKLVLEVYLATKSFPREDQNQLLIARDIGYIKPIKFNSLQDLTITLSKITNGLLRHSRTLIRNS
jgi:hypothetical protein